MPQKEWGNGARSMRKLENLLEELFSERPAVLGKTYVESAVSDKRYSVAHSADFTQHNVSIPSNAPSWIMDDQILGPYEQEIFADILSNSDPLFAVRGGSGSGKSTIASALHNRAHSLSSTVIDD